MTRRGRIFRRRLGFMSSMKSGCKAHYVTRIWRVQQRGLSCGDPLPLVTCCEDCKHAQWCINIRTLESSQLATATRWMQLGCHSNTLNVMGVAYKRWWQALQACFGSCLPARLPTDASLTPLRAAGIAPGKEDSCELLLACSTFKPGRQALQSMRGPCLQLNPCSQQKPCV